MGHKEFTLWLSGFLTNRDSLDKKDIETIIKMLGEINKTTTLHDPHTLNPIRELINPTPVYIPTMPTPKPGDPMVPPFNPTCETGKQMIKDIYGPGNDDYGRKPPMMSNGDHSVLPPNFRKKHK